MKTCMRNASVGSEIVQKCLQEQTTPSIYLALDHWA